MGITGIQVPVPFKRFGSLHVSSIPETCRLVMLIGPNGSGKSSVFEAMLLWAKSHGKAGIRTVEGSYYSADSMVQGGQVVVEATPPLHGSSVHLRTAHRNTPDVLVDSIKRAEPIGTKVVTDRMIETDTSLAKHYQRVVGALLPILSNLESPSAAESLEVALDLMNPVAAALLRLFPSLQYSGLGDPTTAGSFYFTRDGHREFRFENLSGGEKAAFDLLLDVHLAAREVQGLVVGVDEPELHVGPSVHGQLLDELMALCGDDGQLWLATHSLGMIRRAFEIAAAEPAAVSFLDFTGVEGSAPNVDLQPVEASRQFLRKAMSIAIDTAADLQMPQFLYVCEGDPDSSKAPEWDARVYRKLFSDRHLEVEFLSAGGKSELKVAGRIAAALAPGSTVVRVRDRDQLTDDHRAQLMAEDAGLRVLSRFSLESYLTDTEVLEALVESRGGDVNVLISARDNAMDGSGSAKPALGAVFDAARTSLTDRSALGENKWQFGVGALAPLLRPGMAAYEELKSELGLS